MSGKHDLANHLGSIFCGPGARKNLPRGRRTIWNL